MTVIDSLSVAPLVVCRWRNGVGVQLSSGIARARRANPELFR